MSPPIKSNLFQLRFLYVGTENPSLGVATYILESPEFSVSRDMQLSFDVYRRSREITLQKVSVHICASISFLRFLIRVGFCNQRKYFKIFFKALQWRKFKWLAIDNIELSPCSHAATPSEKP
ncbi:unnamed protein product [Nippostrongylus brasiliensis]|uniref:Uncharacterized protein n=1 Tax=Nippostrongylus brasiliensis TaxID=27835 RepID=A0A0N4XM95_NIPBR|nr:unnamed protein product [Nippostrongylus brasiliensis]